jgi:hypothetical protein
MVSFMEKSEHERFPSGKIVTRFFDDRGYLVRTMHYYDDVSCDLCMIITYDESGSAISENYMHNLKSISRKKYDAFRVNYSDMPESGLAKNLHKELLDIKKEKISVWTKKFKSHIPDVFLAKNNDDRLCREKNSENVICIDDEDMSDLIVCFGDKRPKSVSAIRKKAGDIGFSKAWLIDVDRTYTGVSNRVDSGGLIVELPQDNSLRRSIFKKIAKDLTPDEFDPPMDDGQKYEFILYL